MNRQYHRLSVCLAAAFLLLYPLGVNGQNGNSANNNAPVVATDPGPRPIELPGVFAIDIGVNGIQVIDTVQFPPPGGDINSPVGAGFPLNNIPPAVGPQWGNALAVFAEVTSVNGAFDPVAGQPTLLGLGPGFDGTSCFSCHSQPAIGGTSPGPLTFTFPVNPEVPAATANGATNTIPSFVTANGPAREARFVRNPDGSPDGSVHQLFTITGRSDAPAGCSLQQPDFAAEMARNNVVFRIPTPTFGAGFEENVPDATLRANLAADPSEKAALGIGGHFNISQVDNTIARFGWKAQEKSLETFSGEAANVEQGITNELAPNEKADGGCAGNPTPEDNTNILSPAVLAANGPSNVTSLVSSTVENFTIFMRINSPPTQCDFASGLINPPGIPNCNPLGASALRGQVLFGAPKNGGIGCILCHTDTLVSGPSAIPNLNNVPFHPFSDFAVHHMGSNLADGIIQGTAGPDEFRTAPLWGVGQRIFLLHDGRTTDLIQAILAHASSDDDCVSRTGESRTFKVNGQTLTMGGQEESFCGSEANGVVRKFRHLSEAQKQDLLNYLRSL